MDPFVFLCKLCLQFDNKEDVLIAWNDYVYREAEYYTDERILAWDKLLGEVIEGLLASRQAFSYKLLHSLDK